MRPLFIRVVSTSSKTAAAAAGVPTMRMIAKRAGVTSTTVSMALRNSPEISAATKRRIQRIADEMGYQPDTNVAKLMHYLRNRRKQAFHSVVAALTTKPKDDTDPYCIELYKGAQRRAEELGHGFTPFYVDEGFRCAGQLQRTLTSRGVEGILLLPMSRPQSFEMLLDWKAFSVVATTSAVLQPGFHRVVPCHFGNTLMLCDRLSQAGYRRLGLVIHEAFDLVLGHETVAAVVWWNSVRQGEPVEPLVHKNSHPDGVKSWFEQQRPDAIISAGPDHARVIADELNLTIPGVIGFAVLNTGQAARPLIGGGTVCPEQVGSVGMDLLHSIILRGEKGIPALSVETKIKGSWVPGASISPG